MSEENSEVQSESPEMEASQEQESSAEITPAEQKAIAEAWEEFDLKVNGKDVKERINLNDKERIKKALQMEKAANEAFQSSASLKKQQQEMQDNLAEFLQELKSNPLAVLQHQDLGVDVKQMVEAYLQAEIDRSQKSPEQLALEEAQAKLAAIEEERRRDQEELQKAKTERLNQEAAAQLEAEINDVMQKGDLPKSRYLSQKLTDLAYIAYSNGIDLSIAEIAPLVKAQYLADMKEMLGIQNDEVVEGLLGKERIRSMRNKQLQSVKTASTAPTNILKTPDTGASDTKKEESPRLKAKDFFKGLSG